MEPSDALAVQVASLRKLYGSVVAVDDVSFEVECGLAAVLEDLQRVRRHGFTDGELSTLGPWSE